MQDHVSANEGVTCWNPVAEESHGDPRGAVQAGRGGPSCELDLGGVAQPTGSRARLPARAGGPCSGAQRCGTGAVLLPAPSRSGPPRLQRPRRPEQSPHAGPTLGSCRRLSGVTAKCPLGRSCRSTFLRPNTSTDVTNRWTGNREETKRRSRARHRTHSNAGPVSIHGARGLPATLWACAPAEPAVTG